MPRIPLRGNAFETAAIVALLAALPKIGLVGGRKAIVDIQPAARPQRGNPLALFDAVEHLGFEKTSQFRG